MDDSRMKDHELHERRFNGGAERLRSPERIARLEIGRVVALSLEGLAVKSVLDVGTGAGVFAEAFSKSAASVAGIDVSAELLAAARKHVPNALFLEAPAEKLPFADGSFDLLFLGSVLHETDDPLKALEEARRVAISRVAVLEWPYKEEEAGPPIHHRLGLEAIAELAIRAGFEAVEHIALARMDLYRLTP